MKKNNSLTYPHLYVFSLLGKSIFAFIKKLWNRFSQNIETCLPLKIIFELEKVRFFFLYGPRVWGRGREFFFKMYLQQGMYYVVICYQQPIVFYTHPLFAYGKLP
jgi:hypothetical protein